MDPGALARWRLRTLRLAGPPYESATDVVQGLLAVQAENFAQASWAVATRTAGLLQPEFQRLFDAGDILRTHVLRPTWHFVRPDDIRWLVELTAPRINRVWTQNQRRLDLSESTVDGAIAAIRDALAGGNHLTRSELGVRLQDAGLPAEGQRLGVLLARAEMAALICSGATRGKDQTYALVEERAPHARRLDRDAALAEIVLRYFTGHGPATERDLAYWATLTLTDVRAGLAAVSDELDHLDVGGRTYWFAGTPPDDELPDPRGHLLQTLDEYHNGYQDSRGILDVAGIVPHGRAATVGMALVDGQMVGGMRRDATDSNVTFEVSLYRHLDRDEVAALGAAADRYGDFLGLQATASFTAPPDVTSRPPVSSDA